MYVYILIIYPKLHIKAPSVPSWSGMETRDFVRKVTIVRHQSRPIRSSSMSSAVFSGAWCMCFLSFQHIQDMWHVAPVEIDAKYIAVNSSCILFKFRSDMLHINSRITKM